MLAGCLLQHVNWEVSTSLFDGKNHKMRNGDDDDEIYNTVQYAVQADHPKGVNFWLLLQLK